MTADEFLENVWGLSETGELVLQNLNKPELKKNIQITGGNTRRKTGGKIENIESASPNLFLKNFLLLLQQSFGFWIVLRNFLIREIKHTT